MNFNREGETHNTYIGGFFSIILRIALLVYFFVHVNKLIFKEEDDIVYAIRHDPAIELQPVMYGDVNMALFWILRTSDDIENPLWLTDEIKPYVKIEFT